MERRRVGAVAVALLLALVSVQVVDPRVEDRQPPEVDFSDPPAEVAADAAERFEYVDYAYRLDFAYSRDDQWEQMRWMAVDHSDREYYKEGPSGNSGVVIYGTESVTYVRPGNNADWRVMGMREILYPVSVISQPFLPGRIRNSQASISHQNSTSTVVSLDVHPVKVAPQYTGNATLYIDRKSGLILRASIIYETPNGLRFLRFYLTDSNIDLERPEDATSAKEILWDVARGPIVDL